MGIDAICRNLCVYPTFSVMIPLFGHGNPLKKSILAYSNVFGDRINAVLIRVTCVPIRSTCSLLFRRKYGGTENQSPSHWLNMRTGDETILPERHNFLCSDISIALNVFIYFSCSDNFPYCQYCYISCFAILLQSLYNFNVKTI